MQGIPARPARPIGPNAGEQQTESPYFEANGAIDGDKLPVFEHDTYIRRVDRGEEALERPSLVSGPGVFFHPARPSS